MFMISKESMHSAMSLTEKVADAEKGAECIADVENMIRMKESHLARAESASCCNISNLASQIDRELQILRNALEALKRGDRTKARAVLDDYLSLLRENYRPEPERW